MIELSSLTTELQTIQLYNFTMFSKAFWMFYVLAFSLFYIFYLQPKEDKTPFYSVAFFRSFLRAFSFANILGSPLMFLFLSPETNHFMDAYVGIYTTVMTIYFIMLVPDVFRFGFTSMLKLGGFEVKDERDLLAYKKLFGHKNGRFR